MESTDKLRNLADQWAPTRSGYGPKEQMLDIADKIEQEIAELQENWAQEAREHADDSARLAELAHENVELKREIAERYMELPEGWTAEQAGEVLGYWPKWDDGTPCMFGDEFTYYPKYHHEQKYEVLDRLVIFGPNHVWRRGYDDESPHDGGYYEWNFMRPGGDDCESYRPTKHKPRTIEDVLCDLMNDDLWDEDGSYEETKRRIVAKYADELRNMGVGE